MSQQRQNLPPCCHELSPGRKRSSKANFESELTKFAVSPKSDGVQRLATELRDARAALQLEGEAATSLFQTAGDIPAYAQKLIAYLSLVKGFTETVKDHPSTNSAELRASSPSADDNANATLRQPLVEAGEEKESSQAPTHARDRSGCLSFCRWQDALTESMIYALSARQEYSHTLLAAGILMMTDARSKVDALLSERLSELNETQLKLAYQLLLHASGVLDACLEAMDITPRSIGAAFADLGAEDEPNQTSKADSEAILDDDAMTKWREEQRQAQQGSLQKSSSTLPMNTQVTKSPDSGASEDLDMLKRVPDLADGSLPQLLAWIALAEAQELVVLRGVTRETVDFSLMAKLSMDLSTRYKECHAFATRRLPIPTSGIAERIQLYCAFKGPYYQAISTYFQGASCMLTENAQNCAQAVADFKKASSLFEKVIPLEKAYEAKLAASKDERERASLLTSVFLRSQQIIARDLDIATHRNDSVYYEPIPEPEAACGSLSLVKATVFPLVPVNDLWWDEKVANCLKPTAPVAMDTQEKSGQPRKGCCSSCIIS